VCQSSVRPRRSTCSSLCRQRAGASGESMRRYGSSSAVTLRDGSCGANGIRKIGSRPSSAGSKSNRRRLLPSACVEPRASAASARSRPGPSCSWGCFSASPSSSAPIASARRLSSPRVRPRASSDTASSPTRRAARSSGRSNAAPSPSVNAALAAAQPALSVTSVSHGRFSATSGSGAALTSSLIGQVRKASSTSRSVYRSTGTSAGISKATRLRPAIRARAIGRELGRGSVAVLSSG
jgi:hypothetical protein